MFNRFKKALADFTVEMIEELEDNTQPQARTRPPINSPSSPAAGRSSALSQLPRVDRLPLVIEEVPFTLEQEWTVDKFLDDPDPAKQVAAIRFAIDMIRRSPSRQGIVVESFIGIMLTDPDDPARAVAAEGLRYFKRPKGNVDRRDVEGQVFLKYWREIIEALVMGLEEETDTAARQRIAEAYLYQSLVASTPPNGRATAAEVWKNEEDPYTRMCLTASIGEVYIEKLGEGSDAYQQAALYLGQAFLDFPEMRPYIEVKIARLKAGAAIPYMAVAMLNPDEREGLSTVLSTVETIAGPPGKVAVQTYIGDPTESNFNAVRALAKMDNEHMVKLLKAMESDATNEAEQHKIKDALIKAGEAGTTADAIRQFDADPLDFPAQHQAIRALGQIGDDAAIDKLIEIMRGNQNNLSQAAWKELLQYPQPHVIDAMIDGVCDGSLSYRQVSYNFLTKMRQPDAVRRLDAAAKTRATPAAQAKIERDKEFLKRF